MRLFSHWWLCGLVAFVLIVGGCNSSTKEPVQISGDPVSPAVVDPVTKPEVPDEPETKSNNPDEPGDNVKPNPDEPLENPFPRRAEAEEFPDNAQWINTNPLKLKSLKGKFVLLDFWTYCCINCMHILPELKKLEQKYPNELVVIGVHSAKFEGERDTKNIEEAVLRYEIEHPVVNDPQHEIWNSFDISSWPSIRLVDPEGYLVAGHSGEFEFEDMDRFFQQVLPYYRKKGLLDETPVKFDLALEKQKPSPLRFPGKILADEPGDRLFISDSNNNRIVITKLDGTFVAAIGSGLLGRDDGDFATAKFNHPQGMALKGETLYVADTENHLLRKVDLQAKQVTTIGGTGVQGRGVESWPGLGESLPDRFVGPPLKTTINSPWDLWIHGDGLYIAMAGPHQIWKMTLDEKELGLFAGNGREDIVDGALTPSRPYQPGFSSFAQPSGLASDGTWLFVADSEGSSIRAVPFDETKDVKTVVGSAHLPHGRLFAFGDKDGNATDARLQHALGVAYHSGKIYVADTYNNKIKVVDAATGDTKSFAGSGKAGRNDEEPTFDEPSGLAIAKGLVYVADTNNHTIRTIDLASGKVGTLALAGLTPPNPPQLAKKPSFPRATQVAVEKASVKPENGAVKLSVKLTLPEGSKLNPQVPLRYLVEAAGDAAPFAAAELGQLKFVDPPAKTFDILLPVSGDGEQTLTVSLSYFHCQEDGKGLCKIGSVIWTVPVNVSKTAENATIPLEHIVP